MRDKTDSKGRPKRKRPVLDGISSNEDKKVVFLRVSPSLHEHMTKFFGRRKMNPGIIAVLEDFFEKSSRR